MCLVLRVPAAESACGQGRLSASASACGQGVVSAAYSACGQGLRTGAHLRCFPSHRCAAGPSPFTKPRAATPSEVPAHPAFPGRGIMLQPLGWRDCSCFDLCAAAIRKFGLEIGNRCTEVPEMCPMAAAIVKLTPSNQESLHGSPRIDPRGCIDSQVWA